MDFEEFSRETIKEINKELEKLLKNWRNEVGGMSKDLLPLIDEFIAGSTGGKRIRGSLVVLGYELVTSNSVILEARSADRISKDDTLSLQHDKKKVRNDIFKVAAAYEIFHSAILAHDDIIDQSPTRRSQPSLYQALGGNHYGISQTICLADAGFFLAVKIMAESSFPEKEKNEATRLFSQTMLATAIGEMLDVEKGDVDTIMKLKTAQYTVSGPLQLGAILGGAKQNLIEDLGKFGENLGIAFQIQDDILGVFGSPEQLGKSVASDIEEGKKTVLYDFALIKANSLQRQQLSKYYGKGNIGDRGLQQVRQIFKETGALEFAENEAERYRGKSLKAISKLTKDKNMSKLLEQVAESLVKRVK